MEPQLRFPEDALRRFCEQNRIRRLSAFGSVLTTDFRNDSDIDLLVEFEPEARVGLIGVAAMEIELSTLIGRKVDLRTRQDLSRYFRDDVASRARVLYAA